MNNPLYITVGHGARQRGGGVTVVADDYFSVDVMTFDNVDHLLACFPTKDELAAEVLRMPVFTGAAVFKSDGTYQLEAVSAVVVQGFPG